VLLRFQGLLVLILVCLLLAAPPARAVSDSDLDRASRQQAAEEIRQYGLVNDPALVARFRSVFDRVAGAAGHSHWPLVLYVLDDPSPNAFALPNGMFFINKGILTLNPTDDEIAFVMAHEISHVTLEHAKKDINQQQVQGTILSILTGGSGPLVQLAGEAVQAALEGGYTRGQETQADRNALEVMARAGYNPAAALSFFQKLAQVEQRPRGIRAFATHPLTADRIKNVEKWLGQNPSTVGVP
jgi:predicted Zn-dependent protease